MPKWWNELDAVLRGEATRAESLKAGRLELPITRLAIALVLIAMFYGLCMGSFTLWREGGPLWLQLVSTTLKVPALFLLTLLVTFPSLYVFNALIGSQLDVSTVFRLLILSLVVMVTVLASLGPIVAFFGASTSSYAFMKLLNVVIFTIAGALGLGFLLRTLNRLSGLPRVSATPHPTGASPSVPEIPASEAGPSPLIGPLDRAEGEALAKNVKTVFRVWIVLFGIVGGQMAWVLRPFLGAPRAPFMWFRPRSANFFHAVFESVLDLWR